VILSFCGDIDAPKDDGGSTITSYKVEKAIEESQFTDVVYDGPQKECHVKDLEPGMLFLCEFLTKKVFHARKC